MAGFFQTSVTAGPAPGIEGDFCSANQWTSVDAGPGGLIAGSAGLVAGRFAWIDASYIDTDGAPAIANNFGTGTVGGFVHRDMMGTLLAWPLGSISAADRMRIMAGKEVTLLSNGDFWVKNAGSSQALPGMKAFANYADGTVSFAAAGGTGAGGASVTGSVAAGGGSVTGSITNDILTVTAVGSGSIAVGASISGTGIATGTTIVAQRSGTAGGVGTYAVSIPNQTVAATTVTVTFGTLTVTAGSGLNVGDTLTGTGVTAGTRITAANGDGTFTVNKNTVVSSTTLTAGGSIETKWTATSAGLAGELVKISSWPLG